MALLALEVPQQTSSSFSTTQMERLYLESSRAQALPETPGTNDHYIIHSFSSLKEPCRSDIISDVLSAWLSSLTFNL